MTKETNVKIVKILLKLTTDDTKRRFRIVPTADACAVLQ